MAASREKVNFYRSSVINLLENAGWQLINDSSYIQSPGDGLWWVTCLTFKNGDDKKTLHYSGTTRDTLNYFVGARDALLYLAEF